MNDTQDTPLANGGNGERRGARGEDGRFLPGNRAAVGHGSPHGEQVALLRRTLFEKVTPDEIAAVVDALLAAAKKGDVAAAKLILSYSIGEPAVSLVAVNTSVQINSPGALEISPARRADYDAWMAMIDEFRPAAQVPPMLESRPDGGNGNGQH